MILYLFTAETNRIIHELGIEVSQYATKTYDNRDEGILREQQEFTGTHEGFLGYGCTHFEKNNEQGRLSISAFQGTNAAGIVRRILEVAHGPLSFDEMNPEQLMEFIELEEKKERAKREAQMSNPHSAPVPESTESAEQQGYMPNTSQTDFGAMSDETLKKYIQEEEERIAAAEESFDPELKAIVEKMGTRRTETKEQTGHGNTLMEFSGIRGVTEEGKGRAAKLKKEDGTKTIAAHFDSEERHIGTFTIQCGNVLFKGHRTYEKDGETRAKLTIEGPQGALDQAPEHMWVFFGGDIKKMYERCFGIDEDPSE